MKKVLVILAAVLVCSVVGGVVYMKGLYTKMSEVSVGERIGAYPSEKSALVVIDVQEGIVGTLASNFTKGMKDQSDAMIAAINKTVAWAQANQMTVVYIRQENTDLVFNFLTGGLLAKGRPGAEIDKRVNVVSTNIFGKQKMDAFWNPDFAAFLRSQGITTMYVTGLDAANCVDRTIKGALVRGYKVIALKDGIISDTPEKGLAMINEYVKEGVTITTSAELPVPAPQTPVVTIKSKR